MAFYKVICVAILLTLLTQESHSQLSVCGLPILNTKIAGGQVATPGSWPWQVSLQAPYHRCAGTLINNEWVLTAASCCAKSDVTTSTLTVVLGLQSLQGINPNKVSRTVSQIIIHPNYKSGGFENDICLLKLFSPVTFTNYIQPVCLAAPGSTYYKGTVSWATGWGSDGTSTFLPFPENLMEVQVPIVGNRECKCYYGVYFISDNMICAGGKGICNGDEGGPLVSKQGGRWIQAGIASFRTGCTLLTSPGVFTRVSQYQSWINSQITSNQPGFITFTSTGTDGDFSISCQSVPPPMFQVCGQPTLNTRIVGGQVASTGSWPWQATLLLSWTHFCGGSLINNDWVLTAAQCCARSDVNTRSLLVSVGLQNQKGPYTTEMVRGVSQIIIHPNFNPKTFDNDICLLNLVRPVTFNNYIQPVCLAAPGSTFYNGTGAWVTGWGDIGFGVPLPSPGKLMEVQVPIVGNRQCNCNYGVGNITNNMICAGVGGNGTCQGDLGGPLVSKQGGRWIQEGIVSFSVRCAEPNFPGVYTRVSQYQSWINSQITSNEPGFLTFTSNGTDDDLSVTCPGLPAPSTTIIPTTRTPTTTTLTPTTTTRIPTTTTLTPTTTTLTPTTTTRIPTTTTRIPTTTTRIPTTTTLTPTTTTRTTTTTTRTPTTTTRTPTTTTRTTTTTARTTTTRTPTTTTRTPTTTTRTTTTTARTTTTRTPTTTTTNRKSNQ